MEVPFIKTTFMDIPVYTFSMKVKDVISISYVAVRNRHNVAGSVQRVLNKRRISNIRDYVLDGNIFFNTFILNWTNKEVRPKFGNQKLKIPSVEASAQILDGQHRIEGLKEAIKKVPDIGEKEILVSLCTDLSTKEAAKIFLNINTEQKPVPKSLIYDLFGLAEENSNHVINRARDIAEFLNTDEDSPYFDMVKYANAPRSHGAIPLSTFVSTIKKHVGPDGSFSKNNLSALENQKKVFLNYFKAIASYYDEHDLWDKKSKNPFLKSAGFNGAVDHLTLNLLEKCAKAKSFTVEQFQQLLRLDEIGLLYQEELKSQDGKSAIKKVREHLETVQRLELPSDDEFEF